VLKAEVSRLSCLVATMAVEGQQAPLAFTMLGVLMEVLNPFKA
jgi:hypothetical protein